MINLKLHLSRAAFLLALSLALLHSEAAVSQNEQLYDFYMLNPAQMDTLGISVYQAPSDTGVPVAKQYFIYQNTSCKLLQSLGAEKFEWSSIPEDQSKHILALNSHLDQLGRYTDTLQALLLSYPSVWHPTQQLLRPQEEQEDEDDDNGDDSPPWSYCCNDEDPSCCYHSVIPLQFGGNGMSAKSFSVATCRK